MSRYPYFLDTARVGADGNLTGFRFQVFSNPIDATAESFAPGPEVTDIEPFAAVAHLKTALPLAYDPLEGYYCPTMPIAVPAGTILGLFIPAEDGISGDIHRIEVQPAL